MAYQAPSMAHRVTLLPGDGIGPEVSAAVLRIVEAAGVDIEWEQYIVGGHAQDLAGSSLPDEVVESVRRNKVALKGPVETPVGGGFESVNVRLRKVLDLYANLRPVRNLPGVPSRFGDVDLVIVRENTEGLYSGLEHEVVPGVVESLKVITEKASNRIARFAFEYARKNHRKKIHAIHKANIMKLSDGLFLRCARNVAKEYPEITYGEIISDLCAAFVGGLGLVPSANLGDRCAIFEAVHGSAPDIAGKNIANPTAVIRCALLMLRHIGEFDAALKIRNALEKVYRDRDKLTRDVGGKAGTSEFADSVIEAMETSAVVSHRKVVLRPQISG